MTELMADTKKEHVTVRLDPQLINRIERIAREENRTRSNMIEVMLRESVDRYEQQHKRK